MFFTKKKVLIMIIICISFFLFSYNDVRSDEIKEITGYAKIIDGDTIKIKSKKIRSWATHRNGWGDTLRRHPR